MEEGAPVRPILVAREEEGGGRRREEGGGGGKRGEDIKKYMY